MSLPGGWELVLILVVIVLLFGAKKLPDAARSLGRSMRIFKSEVKEMNNDDKPQQPTQIEAPQQNQAQNYQPNPQQNFQQGNPQGFNQQGYNQQGFNQQPQQNYQPGQNPQDYPNNNQ